MAVSCIWVGINAAPFQTWKTEFCFLNKKYQVLAESAQKSHFVFAWSHCQKSNYYHQNGVVGTQKYKGEYLILAHGLRLQTKTPIVTFFFCLLVSWGSGQQCPGGFWGWEEALSQGWAHQQQLSHFTAAKPGTPSWKGNRAGISRVQLWQGGLGAAPLSGCQTMSHFLGCQTVQTSPICLSSFVEKLSIEPFSLSWAIIDLSLTIST